MGRETKMQWSFLFGKGVWREGETCISAIDLATGSVRVVEPAALSFSPKVQVSGPARGRVYIAAGDVSNAYDEAGQEIGLLWRGEDGLCPALEAHVGLEGVSPALMDACYFILMAHRAGKR